MESISASGCSICAEMFFSSEKITVDEDVLNLLTFLFTKIHTSALQNTHICENCSEKIQNACNFKMLFIDYFEGTSNVATEIEGTGSDLSFVCSICKQNLKTSLPMSFTTESKLIINHYLQEGMQRGLEITDNSNICIFCKESILNLHSVIKSLSNFDKEQNCISNADSDVESLDTEYKMEIKEEPLREYSNITNSLIVYIEPMQIDTSQIEMEKEVRQENEINVNVKTDCKGRISTKRLRFPSTFSNIFVRNISTAIQLKFKTTPILLGEPLKKKKKLDPAIIRQREERRKRKIEKQIRRLEKNARQLKPIEECEVPLEVLDQREQLERQLPPLSSEIIEKRILLEKKWARYKQKQHLDDLQMLDRIFFAQQNALDELKKESEELYQEAVQIDFHLIPFNSQGPVETPPIKDYDVPDGDYQDVSRKW